VMRPRSFSRERNTSASVTVTRGMFKVGKLIPPACYFPTLMSFSLEPEVVQWPLGSVTTMCCQIFMKYEVCDTVQM